MKFYVNTIFFIIFFLNKSTSKDIKVKELENEFYNKIKEKDKADLLKIIMSNHYTNKKKKNNQFEKMIELFSVLNNNNRKYSDNKNKLHKSRHYNLNFDDIDQNKINRTISNFSSLSGVNYNNTNSNLISITPKKINLTDEIKEKFNNSSKGVEEHIIKNKYESEIDQDPIIAKLKELKSLSKTVDNMKENNDEKNEFNIEQQRIKNEVKNNNEILEKGKNMNVQILKKLKKSINLNAVANANANANANSSEGEHETDVNKVNELKNFIEIIEETKILIDI